MIEKADLQNKIADWLSDANVGWAKGKTLAESEEHFGNTLEPIAILPPVVRRNVPTLSSDYIFSGKGYMIDHQANHHSELERDEYINIQTILDNYDDIKDLSDGG